MSGNRWNRTGRRAAIVMALVAVGSTGPAAPVSAQEGFRLNYVDADVRDVLRSLGTVLGLNVFIAEDIPLRRVTYTTPDPVPIGQLGNVLETILESEGLVLVQKGPVAQVQLVDQAPATGPVGMGKELAEPVTIGLITQIVPLEFVSPDEALGILEPLAGPLAKLEVMPRSNGIVVTDLSTNVRRYLELLRELDAPADGEAGLRTYVYRLKHAGAAELATTLAQVYGVRVAEVRPRARTELVSDRSLSSTLDAFSQRETDALAMRRATPVPELTTPQVAVPPSGEAAEAGGLVGGTTIVPELATNALIIRTAPPNYPVLEQTIVQLDVRPAQVLLEVVVLEVTLDESTQYGINWSILGGNTGDVEVTGRLGAQRFSDSALSGVQDFVLRAIHLDDVDVRGVIRALASAADVRVLSTPQIVALNNEEARILVGSQVPFSQSTRTGLDVVVDRVVQYRDVGTQLTIVPTINEDGYVTFRILQEVSTLTAQTLEAALNAPIISTREAETSGIVRDRQTIVIGGLIDETEEAFESGVPLLKEIPLLGYLFKSTSTRRVRTELAIFITPYVVLTDEDADAVLRQTRDRLQYWDQMQPDTTGRRP